MTLDQHETGRIAFVTDIINREFHNVHEGGAISIERLTPDFLRVRLAHDPSQIRPGGTVSGPSMFKIADLAVYVGVLNAYGDGGIQAVTTNMSINFLRRPKPGDVLAEARMLKLGRTLAVGDVTLLAEEGASIVGQATATYALPPGTQSPPPR